MENFAVLFTNEGSLPLLFGLSLLGGIIASVTPCSLAMLPIIIGYVGGYSNNTPLKTLVQMLSFVFGTAVVFTIIGIICAITGKVFVAFAGGYFGIIIAGIILIMGLKLTNILDFEIPVIIKQMPQNNGTNTFVYPIMLGAVFALAGTPCSTPILAGIMGFASLSANITQAVIMLFLFSIGQGVILILAGFLTSKLKNLSEFYKFSDFLLKFSGVLLIIAAIYLYYKIFTPFFI